MTQINIVSVVFHSTTNFQSDNTYLCLNQRVTKNILLKMVMGVSSRTTNEAKKNVQQGKNPILLSLCLMMDILILGLSFSWLLLLLIGLNMPKFDQIELNPSIGKTMRNLDDLMVLCLYTTFFTLTTSMFAVIYSFIVLGIKYNWPCCRWLKNKIKEELLGSLNDEKDSNCEPV